MDYIVLVGPILIILILVCKDISGHRNEKKRLKWFEENKLGGWPPASKPPPSPPPYEDN